MTRRVTSIPLRATRRALNSEPFLRFQQDPLIRRDRQDDRHLAVVAAATLSDGASAIDIGANTGSFSRRAVACSPRGRHLAFEPLPEFAACIAAALPTVDVRAVALGEQSGSAPYVRVVDDPGYSGLREGAYPAPFRTETIRVTTSRLDDELPPDITPALIKVDVEGSELGVFRGATETLERARPVVVFEHFPRHAAAYGTRSEAVHEILHDLGLRIFDIDGRGPLSADAFADAAGSELVWNFIAHT